jgi:lysozyme
VHTGSRTERERAASSQGLFFAEPHRIPHSGDPAYPGTYLTQILNHSPEEPPIQTSVHGIFLIKRFEGLRLRAYRDIVGVWTIGFGDTENVRRGQTITVAEAERRLLSRLAKDFEPYVNRMATIAPTTQNQFDAMVSLAYNIGAGAFSKSTLARLHQSGQYAKAALQFGRWNRAGGKYVAALAFRRTAEQSLYLTPDNSPWQHDL